MGTTTTDWPTQSARSATSEHPQDGLCRPGAEREKNPVLPMSVIRKHLSAAGISPTADRLAFRFTSRFDVVDREAYLLHQVHPAKLAADIAGDLASTALIWRGRVGAGVIAAFAPAVLASAIISRRDLSYLRDTRRGRYILAHMPPAAQVIRFVGQGVAWRAAYGHSVIGVILGHLIVGAGWSSGLLHRDQMRLD